MSEGRRRGAIVAAHHAFALLALGMASIAAWNGVVAIRRVWTPLALHLGGRCTLLAAALGASALVTTFVLGARALAWRRGEWAVAGGFELRMAFAFPVALIAYIALAEQPPRDLYLQFSTSLAAGCFAATLLCLQRSSGAMRSKAARVVDFTLFNLCLAAFLGESALRTWANYRPTALFSRFDEGPAAYVESFRRKAGSRRWGFALDSHGYFDDEPGPPREGVTRVISIGDSFSHGSVPQLLHYTTVCERELDGVDVYNMGIPAVGPPEYLHLLRTEALPAKPAAIVVAIFIGNDVCFPDTRVRGLRALFDSDSYLMLTVPRRLARLREEAERQDGDEVERAGAVQQESREPATALTTYADVAREYPFVADPTLETASFSLQQFRNIERTRATSVARTPPGDCYERFFDVMADVQDECGDTPLLVVLIPDEFQVEDDVWELAVGSDTAGLDRHQPQRVIGDWLRERGIPFVDLLPRLLAVQPMADGRRHLYHLRDTHFNARGNDIAGKALAEGLRTLLAR